jgi:dipeptidyl aminopeptidase/acylaminoacyl peptidase
MNASDGTEKFTGPWRWRSVILGLSWLPRRYYVLAFVARGDQEDHFREVWLQRFSPSLFPVGEPLPVTRDLGQHESVSATADGHNVLSVNERAVAALWVWDNEDPHQSKRAPVTAVTRYTMVRWTADGELLYDRIVGDQVHLWLTKPDGSSDRQITFKPNQQMPSPCRASGEVVSVFSTPGQREIRSWNPNLNTSKTLLTGVEHTPPQCSPDGKFVVFTRTAPGRWPSLWRLPVAGGQPVKINDGWSISPAISPDGAYVAAFYSGSPDTLQTPPANIAIIPIQAGKPTRLLNIDRSVVQWAGLRWAPDGKNVSYVDYRDGAANIWIRPISGEPGRRVTDFKADQISSFDWSPDGRKIAFSRVTLSREALLIRDKD